jgi:tetratricopeptide (TPR) repeat protein
VATEARPLAAAARNRRVLLVVGIAAVVAAAAVVGVTLLQTHGERTSVPGAVTKPQPGRPPLDLELNFSVANDPVTQALRRAQTAYDHKQFTQAGSVFLSNMKSPMARIGEAFINWPNGEGLKEIRKLAAAYPKSGLVALNLGWAYYWAGRNADAVSAWRTAARLQPDTPYAVAAENLLHPSSPAGLPPLLTGLALPTAVAKLPPPQQFEALRRAAARRDARAKLLYGSALWTLERPRSAERQFAAAARLAPHDAVARTAAAVGLFSKSSPRPAFAHLGPLTAVFPNSPAVEFHLGVLLLYVGERAKAAKQLRAALRDGPRSPYAKPTQTLLASLIRTRSK